MANTLCMACTTEENEVSFPSVKDFVEHERSGHKIMPKAEAIKPQNIAKTADNPAPAPVVPKREPIILEYRYRGNCEICNGALDTIKVSVGEKDLVIAYCPTDRKQWTSQNVIPLEKQITEFTKGKYIIEKKK